MALNTEQITSSDFLFNRKSIPEELFAEFEMSQIIAQPRRSLFYFRKYGAGLNELENQPNTLLLQVKARHRVIEAVNYRNLFVTNGFENTVDRRIATSQQAINVKQENDKLDIEVFYFLYSNYETIRKSRTQLGSF